MEHLVWDLVQNRRIRRNAADVGSARSAAKRAEHDVDELQEEVDRLTLIVHALWELLSEHTGIGDEALLEKLREVDLRSGRLDGRAPSGPATCPACSRTVAARHVTCLYCGAEMDTHPFRPS